MASTVLLVVLLVLVTWLKRANILFFVESVVNAVQGQAKRRKANRYLSGNFAPVRKEVHTHGLKVIGSLPAGLEGVFARTGPNPEQLAGDYHWFDGDGMLHACRFKGGKVSYCNRYVATARLARERDLGFPIYMRFGDMRGLGGAAHALLQQAKLALGVISRTTGSGTANTALVYHAKRLMALHEGDMPYAVRVMCDGLIQTLGRITYDGKLDHPFTAHPKIDPKTGELFFIGYEVDKQPPGVHYAGADKDGKLEFDVKVELQEAVMMHDFAITEDYAILVDVPLVFRPQEMVKRNTLPLVYDPSRPARFGILPKRPRTGKEVRWFELPAMMIFHVANAWQEGDVVKLFACCFEEFAMDMENGEVPDLMKPRLFELSFDMASGRAESRKVSDVICEFPRIDERLTGHRSRYVYAAIMDPSRTTGAFTGVVKFDLQAAAAGRPAEAGRVEHSGARLGGECVFVPASSGSQGDDNGYLLTYVHDEASGESELVVLDARTMAAKPLARVPLPQRVPYGFHGTWVPEADVQAQAVTT
ncbi:hypothetical protein WJX81_002592 [Elliptochloris bilobata]|uniref:carotenoid 9,10-dioxygenase n=1 Tax=Elliptochloris bilobata TaxID=381761 RepID=A0AAW1S0R0_9CHLO